MWSVSAQNLLVHWIIKDRLSTYAREYLRGLLLDIGCGVKPYELLLAPYVSAHLGLDHPRTLHGLERVDMIGTAYDIPVLDASFDSAVCTSVLEHLEEPEQALRECFRVLKTGGVAIYSAPFIWHIHEEPRDFYRFSRYALTHLFRKVGFEIVHLVPLSGFWTTYGMLLVYYLYRFHRGPMRLLPVIPLAALAIQAVSYLLDRIDRAERWTWMYMAVVRKP